MTTLALVQPTTIDVFIGSCDTQKLVEAFLSGKSPRTIAAYRQDLQDFSRFLNSPSFAATASLLLQSGHGKANELVMNYRSHMIESKLAPATINRRLAAIRSLVDLAQTFGVVNWKLQIKNLKSEPYRDTRGTGVDGFSRMLSSLSGCIGKQARDRAILRLFFDLALRRGEVIGLDIEHIDLARKTISILGKGRQEPQILTMPEQTIQALSGWLHHHPNKTGALFTNFDHTDKGTRMTGTGLYYLIKSLGAKANVIARPHGLRHTAITEAVKSAQSNGIGLEEVMDFSRHKDVKTLLVYRDRERDVQGRLANLVAAKVA